LEDERRAKEHLAHQIRADEGAKLNLKKEVEKAREEGMKEERAKQAEEAVILSEKDAKAAKWAQVLKQDEEKKLSIEEEQREQEENERKRKHKTDAEVAEASKVAAKLKDEAIVAEMIQEEKERV
jgi:hypothetical protein